MLARHVRVWIRSLLGVWLLAGCAPAHAAAPEPFAVVELFTSEGCSSCPPADDVLGQLAHEAELSGRAIYALAFHVDYWDSLGWRDPYSATWATRQQREYAAALHGRGLYTPQMVVNGREEFIGSRGAQARASIASAIARAGSLRLQIKAQRGREYPERVGVRFQLSATPPVDSVLRVALVEAEAVEHVQTGENAGRVLRHVHVVRAFESVALAAGLTGNVSLAWPVGLAPMQRESASVIGYVQQRADMRIIAAARSSAAAAPR
jgi:hypothetical protein